MLIEGFPAAIAGTNCYVLAPAPGEQCVVVDPGYGISGQLEEIIAKHRLHPVAVLLTHGHLDHTFSVLPVCQASGVPAYIHAEDRAALANPWSLLGMIPGEPIFGMADLTFAEPDDVRTLTDAQALNLAGVELGVRHAPGHSRGSVVFELAADQQPNLFAGDVLFAGSIGRTDLVGGSLADMAATLQQVILPMLDETVVHPGHGPQTTIGRERASNPYLRAEFLASAR